jgi:hypothetical protein
MPSSPIEVITSATMTSSSVKPRTCGAADRQVMRRIMTVMLMSKWGR